MSIQSTDGVLRVSQDLLKRMRFAFESNPNPMMFVDAATLRYVDVNQAAIDTYGFTRDQWLTMTPYDLRAPGQVESAKVTLGTPRHAGPTTIETVHMRANGSRLDVHLTSKTVERGGGKIYVVTVQDVTERNEARARATRSEMQLAHDALFDRLTGLPNRLLLNERLTAAISRARDQNKTAAVLVIDLDKFKHVNDSMGHAVGDVVLKEIAGRLRSSARQLDCIARIGDDEFVAVFGDITDLDHAAEIARHLGHAAAEPIRVPDAEIVATCSIGIALFPRDGDDAETLIRNADAALSQAKRDGRAMASFFTPGMHHAAEHRLRLGGRLRQAIAEDTFQLAYQPIYSLNGTLLGSEALIRWPQPDGTVIQPDAFIPYAEDSGLIIPIGAWVLRSACFQNVAWSRALRPLRVNVNVSAKQLADPHFVRTVQRALRDSGLAPNLLELELTETVMSTNVERTAIVVRELRELGVRIAIDDFGTGYNSLATLRSYGVDTLKLDMCFVADIADNRVDQAIASAVIAAAHGLGALVVAEGVETVDQRATLTALRCDAAQGYLFGRPMSAEGFGELQAEPRTNHRWAPRSDRHLRSTTPGIASAEA